MFPCRASVKIALLVHAHHYSRNVEEIFVKFGIGESTENCEVTLFFFFNWIILMTILCEGVPAFVQVGFCIPVLHMCRL